MSSFLSIKSAPGRWCLLVLFSVFALGGSRLEAQTDAQTMTQAYNEAMQAFNKGDWQGAITGLEGVIKMVTDPADQFKLGPIRYTIGAAYFNLANYQKALECFKEFIAKFPQDSRVGEARLAICRATYLSKDYEGAVKLFAQLEQYPAFREQALLVQADCFKELNQPTEQIRVLEKLISPEIKTSPQANGALALADLYFGQDQAEKVLDLVNKLYPKVGLVDNVLALNILTVKLGDAMVEKKHYPQALAAYRAVRTRDQVLNFQKQRIAAMQRQMDANLAAIRGNAALYMRIAGENRQIELSLKQAQELLAEFEKLPDFMPGVVFRMAKVWYDWDKKWQSIVVFQRFMEDFPEAKEREGALYSMILCYMDLIRYGTGQKLCQQYMKEFPQGENVGSVGFLLATASLQQNDAKSAVTFFGMGLDGQSAGNYREQMRVGLANSHFQLGEFAEAKKQYKLYRTEFPKGSLIEEVEYRDAFASLSLGDYEAAMNMFQEYQKKWPEGNWASDCAYRLMVCKYASSQYDPIIADVKAWEKKFPDDMISGEVYALLGDVYAAQNKPAEAAKAFTSSFQKAQVDEVLNYSLFEAAKNLQKLNQWKEISTMFEAFVKEHPDHDSVVAAMYWIGRSKAREGKAEEAKTFLVAQLKTYLNYPKREAVEQLLQQLAMLCSKRPRVAPLPEPAAPPKPVESDVKPVVASADGAPPVATPPPATPVPLPPYDPVEELKKQLLPLEVIANATGRARLLYAEAELAKLRKKNDEVDRIYSGIAASFKPDDLSPVLLALIGDHLLAKGDTAKAQKYYSNLQEDYPKSSYLDFAYVGLGELAFRSGDYPKALSLFTYAADELSALKMKDASMGKARSLLELKKYDEAKKLFTQAAGIREWRGDTTAEAVFYLGEIEARQDRLPEAIAYYQRVFVAYQKYLPWVAKAYIKSAEAFEKLGKRTDAVNSLRELLRNEKLEPFPETGVAEKMLRGWGVSV